MYVRLAFAVAAHLEPEILVVDEVLAVGDLEFQKKCLGKMSQVAGEGRTVLFVSHSMAAVKSLCTQAILLHEGTVVGRGAVEDTVAHYLNLNSPLQEDGLISETANRIGTGEALLRKVELRSHTGQVIDQLMMGEQFTIATLFEVKSRIEDAFVEVGISTLDGLRVATVQSIDEARPSWNLQPGLQEITVEIDTTLLPREYVIDVVVGHLSGLAIDWVERTFRFTALNITPDSTDHYRWGEVRGFVRPKSVWQGPYQASG
jgi:lipopolysaccharide transport system ATP-binding protein